MKPNAVAAELLKLRRSPIWIVVVVLPLFTVITGTVNYVMNLQAFTGGWDSYWGQVTLFYGLLFLSVGIAILGSSVWRMEHRGNWPRLMSGPTSSWTIVGAKLAVLGILVAAMQAALLVLTWIAGVVFAGLPAALPPQFLLSVAVAALAGLSVAALQSLISMLVRSFAAPIAVGVLGCVVSIGFVLNGSVWATMFLPYALVTNALSLGSSAVTTAAALDLTQIVQVAAPSLALTIALVWLAGAILDRRDVRA
ncbi:ABC transporter permease [Ammonicoccus fulvus]|uniref:ABC transporter permease n=1 Tax=Ammonicoccus fulvus TaxID=3138240 RepID=A0ABZ3FQ53_9ACTN